MIILGIDPGTRRTGYGIIEWQKDSLPAVRKAGVIRLSEDDGLPDRLHRLHLELEPLFREFRPDVTVIEKIFFGRNADSAFKLGHARGVCLMEAAMHGSRVEEYAARFVKKAVTGNGAADKEHVRLVVTTELRYRPIEMDMDVSDALALAYCYIHQAGIEEKLRRGFGASP